MNWEMFAATIVWCALVISGVTAMFCGILWLEDCEEERMIAKVFVVSVAVLIVCFAVINGMDWGPHNKGGVR